MHGVTMKTFHFINYMVITCYSLLIHNGRNDVRKFLSGITNRIILHPAGADLRLVAKLIVILLDKASPIISKSLTFHKSCEHKCNSVVTRRTVEVERNWKENGGR